MGLLVSVVACSDTNDPDPGTSPADHLVGAPGDNAASAIARLTFAPRASDYTTTHPQLAGVPISFNTLLVTFAPSATVGDVNAVLDDVRADIVGGITGVAGQAGGVLVLRLPTTTHAAMESALAGLRARPAVRHAAQDVRLGPTAIPRPNAGTPLAWSWDIPAGGGNWGLEASRVPQLWNLNAAVRKAAGSATIGVFDVGFASSHEDLAYDAVATPGVVASHGTHVAGTISATADNGKGVDGVTPFAGLAVWGSSTASLGELMTALDSVVRARPDIRVVNMSLAFNWGVAGINTTTSTAARQLADEQGALWVEMLTALAAGGVALPVIVAASGNDSNFGFGTQPARDASPMNNAALAKGVAAIIVVESDSLPSAGTASITRSSFSNPGGHLSAPGSQILSTDTAGTYSLKSGTSMASPLVSGVIGYLYALEPSFPRPTLTANPMRDLLVATATPALGGAQVRMDAFAAALRLDVVRGSTKVLRDLVDIDDGTLDGNTRRDANGVDTSVEDADGDGGPGDGVVDMSDFRRWRDGLLQAEDAVGLALDGAANHVKKDLNGDRLVGTPASENIYPRGDFNGDGLVHRSLARAVAGALAGAVVTDLQVLQHLFSDADYQAADLPALLNSADLEVNPARCLASANVARVRSIVRVKGAPLSAPAQPARLHSSGATATRSYTLPVNAAGYTARVEALDASGATIGVAEQDFPLVLGSDARWDPACGSVQLSIVFPTTLTPGVATPLDVLVQLRDLSSGALTAAANVEVTVVPAGGTVTPSSGVTNALGRFVASATLTAGNAQLVLLVTATTATGATVTQAVTATALPVASRDGQYLGPARLIFLVSPGDSPPEFTDGWWVLNAGTSAFQLRRGAGQTIPTGCFAGSCFFGFTMNGDAFSKAVAENITITGSLAGTRLQIVIEDLRPGACFLANADNQTPCRYTFDGTFVPR